MLKVTKKLTIKDFCVLMGVKKDLWNADNTDLL